MPKVNMGIDHYQMIVRRKVTRSGRERAENPKEVCF
jgi:hypothetical protein